jgi:hypothetical protein
MVTPLVYTGMMKAIASITYLVYWANKSLQSNNLVVPAMEKIIDDVSTCSRFQSKNEILYFEVKVGNI